MSEKRNRMANVALGGMVWTFAERISAQLVTLIVSIILARLLSPDEYAVVAIVMVFVTIANVFVTSGFGSALVQKIDSDNLDFSTTFYFSIAMSVVMYIILFLVAPLIAQFYEMPTLVSVIRVMSIRLIFASINSVQQAYVAKKMEFKKFFLSTLIGTTASAIVGIVMAYRGMGVWALVGQYLTNVIVDTFVLAVVCGWKPVFAFSFERMKPLFSFGWKIIVSDVLNKTSGQVRSLVISKTASPTELSFNNQGEKLPALFINNIETSMQKVLAPIVSSAQENKKQVLEITRKSIRVSVFLIWPLLFGLAAIGDSLINVLYTSKWAGSVPYMRLVCIGFLTYPVAETYIRTVKALGKSDLFMKSMIVSQVLGIVLLGLTIVFHLPPAYIVTTWIVSQMVLCIMNGYTNKRLVSYQLIDRIKDVYKTAICCILMFVAVFITSRLSISVFASLIIQIAVGFLVYIVSSYIINRATMLYVYGVIKIFITHVSRRNAT